jgi:hypothetical protein
MQGPEAMQASAAKPQHLAHATPMSSPHVPTSGGVLATHGAGSHGGSPHPGHAGAGPQPGQPAATHAAPGDAHAAAATPAQAQPQKQYMTMKTAQTPYHVDESQVHAHTQRYVAAGHTPEQAHAKALKHHGIALYQGDGAGHFKKVPG